MQDVRLRPVASPRSALPVRTPAAAGATDRYSPGDPSRPKCTSCPPPADTPPLLALPGPPGVGAPPENNRLDASVLGQIPSESHEVTPKGTRQVVFVFDPGVRASLLKNVHAIGSWDNQGRWSQEWKESGVPLRYDEKSRCWVSLPVTLQVEDEEKVWEWGIVADTASGKGQWGVFGEGGNLRFKPDRPLTVQTYAPTTYHRMGATKGGHSDLDFRYWAPHAQNVSVRMWKDDPSQSVVVPMTKDAQGLWSASMPFGWKDYQGWVYAYDVLGSDGQSRLQADPYARVRQGPQRGLSELYLDPVTGREVHEYYVNPERKAQGLPSFLPLLRFEVQGHTDAEAVYLTLRNESGEVLNKAALSNRLGEFDSELVRKYHHGQFSDFGLDQMDDQGRIPLVRQGAAWASVLHNPAALAGLEYRLEVHKREPNGTLRIVGDRNNDGVLSAEEGRRTAFNDPYSGVVSRQLGFERFGIIREPQHDWKFDNAPRERNKARWIVYQMHVGSFYGQAGNVDRSTFEDVQKHFEYLKELGINTVEFLPTNSMDAARDWGYRTGNNSFATTENYGFEDAGGRWVNGTEALWQTIDSGHGAGLNFINDVVYNHFGGRTNHTWQTDGPQNPWHNWSPTPASSLEMRHTDWGAMPAYNQHMVRQFFVDNALAQLDESHFDGLRFDFTHPMHESGESNGVKYGGGIDGWNMLRDINRMVHYYFPDAVTSAEEFPNSHALTKPAGRNGEGGAGFDTMWNTEFQHRLVHDHSNPSVLQQAARGHKTDMDKMMYHLLFHPGFENNMNSTTVISNHDERGNAAPTINVAMDHQPGLPTTWARSAARMTFAFGMLSPGMPIMFQGEESLARNAFKWGVPSTWDLGWEWRDVGKTWAWNQVRFDDAHRQKLARLADMGRVERVRDAEWKQLSDVDRKVVQYLSEVPANAREDAQYNIMRRQHFNFCKSVIALRQSSPAFDGDAYAHGVYTHNDDSVAAYTRKKDGEEFLVIGSLNKNNLSGYVIPFPSGQWQLVLNSGDTAYGGDGFGGGLKDGKVDLPAGGVLVYKRVA